MSASREPITAIATVLYISRRSKHHHRLGLYKYIQKVLRPFEKVRSDETVAVYLISHRRVNIRIKNNIIAYRYRTFWTSGALKRIIFPFIVAASEYKQSKSESRSVQDQLKSLPFRRPAGKTKG